MMQGTSPKNFRNLVPNDVIRNAIMEGYLNLSTNTSREVFWSYVSGQVEENTLHELRRLPESEVYSLYGEAFMAYVGELFDSLAGSDDS